MKKIFFFTIFFVVYSQIFSFLTLKEKEYAKRLFDSAEILINLGNYEKAKSIAIKLKYDYADSEFYSMANYLLAYIDYYRNSFFTSTYFLEVSINEIGKYNFPQNFINKLNILAGKIYIKTGDYEKAISFLERSRIINDEKIASQSNLYLALIYYEKQLFEKSNFYFLNINYQVLNRIDKNLYDYLSNFLGWMQIDTSKIGYKDPNINSIYVENEYVYIGLWHGGLIVYNYLLGSYNYYSTPIITSDEIRAIIATEKNIWIGSTDGLNCINKRNNSIRKITGTNNINISNMIFFDDKIIIGTLYNGIYIFNPETERIERNYLENKSIAYIFENQNKIYISTYSKELYLLENGLIKSININLKNHITSMEYLDNKLYLSTYGSGLIIYENGRIEYMNSKNSIIENDYILTMVKRNGKLYMGTLGSGIYIFENKKIEKMKVTNYYLANDIQKLYIYKNYMFIGTLGEGVLVKVF